MPNFTNSFKIDDFINRKDKSTVETLKNCEIYDVTNIKKAIIGVYTAPLKGKYEAYKNSQKTAIKLNKELDEKKKILADLEEEAENNIGQELFDFMEDFIAEPKPEEAQPQAAEEAQPQAAQGPTIEQRIAEAKLGVTDWETAIKNTENNITLLKNAFINAGGVLNDSDQIDMNYYVPKINNLSDDKKKKLGQKMLRHLKKYENKKNATDFKDSLPWFGDYDIDFQEEIDNEDEIDNDITNIVKDTTGKILPEVEQSNPFSGDINVIKEAKEKATNIESKIWYTLAHNAKRNVLKDNDLDMDELELSPEKLGLPEDLEMPEDEETFLNESNDKVVDIFNIKDRESAINALKTLAVIKNKINYEAGREAERIEGILENEDLKKEKADYIVSNGHSLSKYLQEAYKELEIKVHAKARKALSNGVKISDRMTVDEFTSFMGYTSEEKLKYYRNHNVKESDYIEKIFESGENPQNEVLYEYGKRAFEKISKDVEEEVKKDIPNNDKERIERGSHILSGKEDISDELWEDEAGNKIVKNIAGAEAVISFRKFNNIVVKGVSLEGEGINKSVEDIFKEEYIEKIVVAEDLNLNNNAANADANPANAEPDQANAEPDPANAEPDQANAEPDPANAEPDQANAEPNPAAESRLEEALDHDVVDENYNENEEDIEEENEIDQNDNKIETHEEKIKGWAKEFKPVGEKWDLEKFDNDTAIFITNELMLNVADDSKKKLVDMATGLVTGEGREQALAKVGIDDVSMTMRSSQYMLWLIANKGADVKNVLSIGADAANKKEFVDFCNNNPTDESAEYKNIAAWSNVYKRAYSKIRNYKLPDIDYSDPAKVKENIDELTAISALAANGSKLIEKTFERCKNGKIIACNEMGNEKYEDMVSFTKGLGVLTKPLQNAYINVPCMNIYKKAFEKQVKEFALNRYIAGHRMKDFAGQELKEALENKFVKGGNQYLNYCDQAFKNKILDVERNPNGSHLDRNSAVNMMKNKGGLNGKTADLDKLYISNLTGFSNSDIYYNLTEFKKGLNTDGGFLGKMGAPGRVQSILMDIDSPQQMKEFLGATYDLQPISRWLDEAMEPLVKGDMFKETLKKNGIKLSDMIMISGMPAGEVFGDRYNFVENPAEKEQLVLLETLKYMYRGDNNIEIKTYKLNKAEKLIEDGTIQMMPNKKVVEEMIIGKAALDAGLKGIAEKLKAYRNDLIDALPPEEGETRKDREERFLEDGTDLYVDMAEALDKAIKAVENRDTKPDQVRNALQRYQKASAEYYSHRKGIFFGPRSDMGRNRLAVSDASRKEMINVIMEYDNLRRDLNMEYAVGNNNTPVKDASYNEIDKEIEILKPRYRVMFDMHPEGREAEAEAKAQNIHNISSKQVELLKILLKENNSVRPMNYKNYNPDDLVIDKPEQPLLQYAKNYLTKKYIDAMLKPDNKPKDIQKLINSVKDDKFKRAAINLSNNAKFIEITRNNPGNYYSLMKDYENTVKEQKKIRDGKKTILDAKNLLIGIENNDYAAYIKAPNGNGNPAGQEDAGYTRLTEIVFAQILSTKGYNHIAYSNALGEKGIKAAKKSMTEHFKELKILETLNDEELNKTISTGAIKNYTLDISTKGMDKNTAFVKHLGVLTIKKAEKALKPEDGAGKNAENNEIKRRNSMVMKGENKGKSKGRKRSDSFESVKKSL